MLLSIELYENRRGRLTTIVTGWLKCVNFFEISIIADLARSGKREITRSRPQAPARTATFRAGIRDRFSATALKCAHYTELVRDTRTKWSTVITIDSPLKDAACNLQQKSCSPAAAGTAGAGAAVKARERPPLFDQRVIYRSWAGKGGACGNSF